MSRRAASKTQSRRLNHKHMAIQTQIMVQTNTITKQKVASARIVNLQEMSFDAFCDYLAQDSTVGAADVAAVMTQLSKKLPLLVALGTKVKVSPDGMTVKPTIKGSLTQAQLHDKLVARKAELTAAGDTEAAAKIDVNRELVAADLKTSDLTAGLDIDFGTKFVTAFGKNAELKRVSKSSSVEETTGDSGGDDDVTEM